MGAPGAPAAINAPFTQMSLAELVNLITTPGASVQIAVRSTVMSPWTTYARPVASHTPSIVIGPPETPMPFVPLSDTTFPENVGNESTSIRIASSSFHVISLSVMAAKELASWIPAVSLLWIVQCDIGASAMLR